MLEIIAPLLALALGLVVGWLWAASRTGRALASARDELAEVRAQRARLEAESEARRVALGEAKDAFDALAGKVLKQTSEQFLVLAETRLKTTHESHARDLEARQKAIETLVKPLGENLAKLEKASHELEGKREKAYGAIVQQFEDLRMATTALGQSSQALTAALKGSSQARGRWGEMTLRRLVEMAGMVEHCDFDEQAQAEGLRPDLVVKLPGGGLIPVDSKAPLKDYTDACEAEDATVRDGHLQAHARATRNFVLELKKKDYPSRLEGAIDFTVMFVPAEAVLSAAFSVRPEIQEEALENRILIATPVTLMALLRTVGIYWRQERLAENAEKVVEAAHELYDRTAVFQEHLSKVGKGLAGAVDAFNRAVGSFESRVIPAGRRLDELGARRGTTRELAAPPPVEKAVRDLPPSA